jgi:nitrogen fixation-related uncharacterized protein
VDPKKKQFEDDEEVKEVSLDDEEDNAEMEDPLDKLT